MPTQFLNKEQRKIYGKYAYAPSPEQLDRYFYLDDRDTDIILKLRGSHNRLGFALQLCTIRFLGTNITNLSTVPKSTVNFVAEQLHIRNRGCLTQYSEDRRQAHLKEIKRLYGYSEYGDDSARFRFLRWLYTRVWIGDERPSVLFDLATRQLLVTKTLLPGLTTLERIVNQAREKANSRLHRKLNALLPPEEEANLLKLLEPSSVTRTSLIDYIKRPEQGITSTTILTILRKLAIIGEINIHQVRLSAIPRNRLKQLSRHAEKAHVFSLRRMPKQKRIATLFAFAVEAKNTLIDDTLDIFEEFIADIKRNAKKVGEKYRLRTLRDLDEAALLLSAVCVVMTNNDRVRLDVGNTIYNITPKSKIEEAITTIESIARPPEDTYQEEWLTHYNRIRRFLPTFQKSIVLKATSSADTLLSAYNQLDSLPATGKIPKNNISVPQFS